MRKLVKLVRYAPWLLVLLLTAGCDSAAPATQTPPTPISSGLSGSPVSGSVSPASTVQAGSPALTNGSVAAPTLMIAPTATAQPQPTGSVSARDTVLQGVRQLAVQSTFRYRLKQTGELRGGGSLSQLVAEGQGEWQRPAFHQALNFVQAGQSQAVEGFGNDRQLYQRVTALVAWRKLPTPVVGPFPPPDRVAQAGNFTQAGQEGVNDQTTTRYSWQGSVGNLLEGPEGLGALSITNLYLAFADDRTALAQGTIWLNETNKQIVRYEYTTTLTAGDTTLNYRATYDYSDFNASLTVTPPGDLPKAN